MRKLIPATLVTGLALALSACGGGGVFNRGAPDEFAVTRQAPLVIPPDYALTPPSVGTAGSDNSGNEDEMLKAMFGGTAGRSAAEAAIIGQAGEAAAGIRSSVGDPDTMTVAKGAVTRAIIAAPASNGQGVSTSVQ